MSGRSVGAVRSRGVASQSFSLLNDQFSWLKVWRGGAGGLRRDGTSTQAETRPGRRGMKADGFGYKRDICNQMGAAVLNAGL